jgi:predicted dehydrogenase
MLQRALIVGYGSIGARHARLLVELGCHTSVVSRRTVDFPVVYHSLQEAISVEMPDYIVIANETNQHHDTLLALAQYGYTGMVLVEKPLFSNMVELVSLPFSNVFVAYNLRFHPIIQRLKTLLEGEAILSVQAYVGQYLPDWRPSTDYRKSYSASAIQGGGALRDLSHELDYLSWILGGWQRVSAIGGHLSPLEISSDDIFALMLVTRACPVVMLQLNYLDRLARRTVLINTSKHTIEADLIKGTITIDRESESIPVGRDDTYRGMHEAILSGSIDTLCSLDEGIETLRLIEAAENATKRGEWVAR